MLDAKFLEVLGKEGVVSIVTWSDDEPHLAATWNSYMHKTDDDKFLIPVHGMETTQENLEKNDRIKMVIGSKEVQGIYGPGAGFLLEGTAKMLDQGDELTTIQKKFDWAQSVLEVTLTKVTQTA